MLSFKAIPIKPAIPIKGLKPNGNPANQRFKNANPADNAATAPKIPASKNEAYVARAKELQKDLETAFLDRSEGSKPG